MKRNTWVLPILDPSYDYDDDDYDDDDDDDDDNDDDDDVVGRK